MRSKTKLAIVFTLIFSFSIVTLVIANNMNLIEKTTNPTQTASPSISPNPTPTQTTNPTASPTVANSTPDVKIEDFKWTSGWQPLVGVEADCEFNITIHNLVDKEVDGLAINIIMFSGDGNQMSLHKVEFFGSGVIGADAKIEPFDGALHSGEVRTLRGLVTTDWNAIISAGRNITTTAKVMFGNTIIDQITVP